MTHANTQEAEENRRALLRKWRPQCKADAYSLEESGILTLHLRFPRNSGDRAHHSPKGRGMTEPPRRAAEPNFHPAARAANLQNGTNLPVEAFAVGTLPRRKIE